MKKIITLATLIAISSTAMAGFTGNAQTNTPNGGFKGEGSQGAVTTVQQALKAYDDTPVTLTGKITRQVDNDEFYFKDTTGEIKIEVEDYAWNGLNVTPNDTIVIQGKVDTNDWGKSDIEVYSIQKR